MDELFRSTLDSSLASRPAGKKGVERCLRETVVWGVAIEELLVMVSLLDLYSRFRLSSEIDIELGVTVLT